MLPNNMQHQYWVTKKSVLRKLGGKEDECIISSDAELDAKLELFKSVNETCVQLQRVIDLYQERLCYLAQEENSLGRYLKECGKNEKNASASQLMTIAGKALAYTGHQRLTVRPSLVRLHHEVETFRARAISDTRITVSEMEKARTEYRGALSWMKSISSGAQLDPDTGYGLEKFRKAQSYVKASKTKFDRYTLACLQKVDLLAAARCNMFSHALVPYHNALNAVATKALETLTLAEAKLLKVEEPYDFSAVTELVDPILSRQDDEKASSKEEKDRNTFFNADYTDDANEADPSQTLGSTKKKVAGDDNSNKDKVAQDDSISNSLLGDEFAAPPSIPTSKTPAASLEASSASALLELEDLSIASSLSDLLGTQPNDAAANFLPSHLLQDSWPMFNAKTAESDKEDLESTVGKHETLKTNSNKVNQSTNSGKVQSQMSWLSLFAELDPLANCVMENNSAGDRA